MLNGKFGVLQLLKHQTQGVVCFCIFRPDTQVLLVALNRHFELTLLVGNPSQNKNGTRVLMFQQYALTHVVGLLEAALPEML